MGENKNKIGLLRDNIDDIDRQIVSLLDNRMGMAFEIGLLKAKENMAVFAEEREKQIRTHLESAQTQHISREELFILFEAIIKVGRQHGYKAKNMDV